MDKEKVKQEAEITFKKYVIKVKEIMYIRYKDAKKGIARHNIASVNADNEWLRDYYNEGLTPLEAIIETELDNQ